MLTFQGNFWSWNAARTLADNPAEKWSELHTAKELFEAVGIAYDSSSDDSEEDGVYDAIRPEDIPDLQQPELSIKLIKIVFPYYSSKSLYILLKITIIIILMQLLSPCHYYYTIT